LPNSSSDLPENAVRFPGHESGQLSKTFSYLVLHREEFTQPHVLPRALWRSYRHVSPITVSGWSVLCCTCRHSLLRESARTLSGSPPYGVRTFLSRKNFGSDCPTCSILQGWISLTKNVQQNQSEFILKNFQLPISIVSPTSRAGSAIFPSLMNFKSYSVGTSFPCASLRRITTFRTEDFFSPPLAIIACVSVIPS
jgi:hypothetical protein